MWECLGAICWIYVLSSLTLSVQQPPPRWQELAFDALRSHYLVPSWHPHKVMGAVKHWSASPSGCQGQSNWRCSGHSYLSVPFSCFFPGSPPFSGSLPSIFQLSPVSVYPPSLSSFPLNISTELSLERYLHKTIIKGARVTFPYRPGSMALTNEADGQESKLLVFYWNFALGIQYLHEVTKHSRV